MTILKTLVLRMIKAIFLDWFNTLARYEPPREELHSRTLQEFGIKLSPQEVMRGLLAADGYFFEENARSPVVKRSPTEQTEVYIQYNNIILTTAGVKVAKEQLLKIMKRGQEVFQGVTFVLFDDVLSTLKPLKEQKFILGLLTNLTSDINRICRSLGLEPYLDFVVSSGIVGIDKPAPQFFLAALENAGVEPQEAVHVGDQYKLDVVGARGVGINPILIDRYDLYPDVSDCPRIRTLPEVAKYI